MNEKTLRSGRYPFILGLFAGTLVGAALATWLAPRGSETYRQVSTRVARVADQLAQRGRNVRDDVADAVAHGAQVVTRAAGELERVVTATRSPRGSAKPSL
jgi:gas vesicle protein